MANFRNHIGLRGFSSLLLLATFFYSGNLRAKSDTLAIAIEEGLRHDSSTVYFKELFSLVKTGKDSANWYLGVAKHFFYNDNFDSSLSSVSSALKVFRNLKTDSAQFQIGLRLRVYLYSQMGLYDEALDDAQEALEIAENLKDSSEISNLYGMIANIYHDYSDFEIGVAYAKKALQVAKNRDDIDNIVLSLNDIAINFDDWGMYDSALYYHGLNLALEPQIREMPESKWRRTLGRTYNNIGNTLLKKKDYDSALSMLRMSYYVGVKYPYDLATCLTNLGTAHFKLGHKDSADFYFSLAEEQAEKSGSIEKKRDLHFQKYEMYKQFGDYQKALIEREAYDDLNDSVFREMRAQKIAAMETRYQTEKKEQKINILEKDNALQASVIERNKLFIALMGALLLVLIIGFVLWRSRQKARQRAVMQEQKIRMREAQISAMISSQEAERKRFAADLHDGMGQLISALQLNIVGMKKAELKDVENRDQLYENSRAILGDIHSEVRNIAFNLMPHVLVNEGLEAALKVLAERINNAGEKRVELNFFEMNNRLPEIQEVAIYRIVQEVISNILQYSDATDISLQMIAYQDELIVMIEDNGMGYDLKLFKNSPGNGWKNIQSRVSLIQAKIDFDSQQGRRNNTVTLTVPLNVSPQETHQQQDFSAKNAE